ncbi:MAG TPA: pilus assembly protein TadG-related protein [Abditibacterium sp.]
MRTLHHQNRFRASRKARRSGISMYLFVGTLPVIMGMIGLVIDLSNLYTRRAMAQRAADAAALAGAMISAPDPNDPTKSNDAEIIAEAENYALENGYAKKDVRVDPHVGGQLGKVQVTLGRNEQVFFIPILELLLGKDTFGSRNVGATATAEKISDVPLPLGGNYGTTTGASNPAAFGPYALHSFGDPYSVLYHEDGTPNTPENISKNKGQGFDGTSHYQPDGFSYSMTVSSQFASANPFLKVQLYDPDGHFSNDGQALDERHTEFRGQQPAIPQTTTRYIINKVNADRSLTEVAKVEYGDDVSVDAPTLKAAGKSPWITPDGFKIDLGRFGPGQYKIMVKTIDGSSENGYNLRAGPDYPEPEVRARTAAEWSQLEQDWNNQYGDKGGLDPYNVQVPIQADNHLQMNFTRTDHVRVRLGEIPPSAAGKDVTVTKFDTDVGSTSIKYSFVPKGSTTPIQAEGQDFLNPANDTWSQNTVKVPDTFPGGYIYAEYDAGQQDTSSWSVKVPGVTPGSVRLVR